MHAIHTDRGKPLAAEQHFGHDRFFPDLEPILEVSQGEEVSMDTTDAFDGQISPTTTDKDLAKLSTTIAAAASVPRRLR
jgi:formamidase